MEYFKLRYLIILLIFSGINVLLNDHWTSDKGWMKVVMVISGLISTGFWLILSTISNFKKSHLKNEVFYYIGIGVWHIILTIGYFKFQVLENKDSDVLTWTPYLLIIILCLLPFNQIWSNNKENGSRQLNELKKE